jgi:hypothetical protein
MVRLFQQATGRWAAWSLILLLGSSPGLHSQATPKPDDAPTKSVPLTPKEQRQAQITADTERLYKLAQELKVELDKSNKDTLSITVIKKADEVERLAHSLKERLKSN